MAGAFLSRLWLGLEECRVHPRGIEIKGLAVEGEVELGGARVDGRLRTPLVGFMADSCDFADGFSIGNARVESVFLTRCSFGRPNDEGSVPLVVSAAEILGQLNLSECVCHGLFYAENVVVDDNLVLTMLDCAGMVVLVGAEIRGALLVTRLTFDRVPANASGAFCSMAMDGAVVGDRLHIASSFFPNGLSMARATADGVVISRCRIGEVDSPAPLGLSFCSIARNVMLQGNHIRGAITAAGMQFGGDFLVRRNVVGAKEADAVSLYAPKIRGTELLVSQSRLYGQCRVEQSMLDGNLHFRHVDIRLKDAGQTALSAKSMTAGDVILDCLHMGGSIDFSYINVQSVSVTDAFCNGRSGMKRRKTGETGSIPIAAGIMLNWSHVSRWVTIFQSAIAGGVQAQCAEIGGQCSLEASWLGAASDEQSFYASGARVGDIFAVVRLVAPAGLSMPLFKCDEVQIRGSRIGTSARDDTARHCIWMSEAEIGRRLAMCRSREIDGRDGGNEFHGLADFRNCRVGEGVKIASVRMVPDRRTSSEAKGDVITFAGSSIEGLLSIGNDRVTNSETSTGAEEFPPEILGALVLDDATIQHVAIGHDTSITAVGEIRPPAGDSNSADCVRRLKRGVALSMVGTKVSRRFRLDAVALIGLVDLRDASVGELVDAGGGRWERAGVEPGHLLLDGLTYDDLDDDEDVMTEPPVEQGSHARPKGVVERRLDWLAMQYSGRVASAANFTPQPYEQLARHYAQMGDERARRQVHVARRNLQRHHSGLGAIERWSDSVLNFVSRYGYSPGRASGVTASFLIIGALLCLHLASIGAIVPGDPESPPAQQFSAFLYAADVAIPFLDLGYDGKWTIDSKAIRPFWGRDFLVAGLLALYRLAGLILLSITVLTFSGILREKE